MPGDCSVVTASPEETQQLGRELATALVSGDVIALTGNLGSGKTCMIQGICRGLGVCDYVNSPTFVLANEYEGVLGGRSITVFHLDLYRLAGRAELEDLGAGGVFLRARRLSGRMGRPGQRAFYRQTGGTCSSNI